MNEANSNNPPGNQIMQVPKPNEAGISLVVTLPQTHRTARTRVVKVIKTIPQEYGAAVVARGDHPAIEAPKEFALEDVF